MKKSAIALLLITTTIGCNVHAFEQDDRFEQLESTSWSKSSVMDSYATTIGWAGYLSVNAGATEHNSEINVEGVSSSLKLLDS